MVMEAGKGRKKVSDLALVWAKSLRSQEKRPSTDVTALSRRTAGETQRRETVLGFVSETKA